MLGAMLPAYHYLMLGDMLPTSILMVGKTVRHEHSLRRGPCSAQGSFIFNPPNNVDPKRPRPPLNFGAVNQDRGYTRTSDISAQETWQSPSWAWESNPIARSWPSAGGYIYPL